MQLLTVAALMSLLGSGAAFSVARRTAAVRMASSSSSSSSSAVAATAAAAASSSSASSLNRRSFLDLPAAAAAAAGMATFLGGAPLPVRAEEIAGTGLNYKVLKAGGGLKPVRGDLCAIRFQGSYNGNVFDDILGAEEPLYFRVGDGRLLKGIETAIVNMPVGAKWELDIPAELAFGNGGRPASPGKPRIPPGARINYILELSGVPGKEEDLMEVIGDFN